MEGRIESQLDEPLKRYWQWRFRQHLEDRYAGLPLMKFPEDLRVYEHLLWSSRPNTVIELGSYGGGSALWFRDRLRTMADHGRIADFRVISIDLNKVGVEGDHITFLHADLRDEGLPERVAALLSPLARCFVVEDSAHTYETTSTSLRAFARFVPSGGFFVVEDGCIDIKPMRVKEMRLGAKGIGPIRRRRWPHGVLPAVHDWLASEEGHEFVMRRDLELYGLTCHPQGILQRNVR